MTERLRAHPSAAYHQGDPRRASPSGGEGLSTKKTMLVMVVVVGCFAVLWPKLFYPMLVNNANSQMKPGPVDKTTGCCDVISELDVDTIKIMSELCSTMIDTTGKTPPSPKEIVTQCRKAVLETCGIDISAALQDRIVSLGHSVKQILEEVRSLNGSLCLKYNFGLAPWRLGVPHRVNINLDPLNSIRQERPSQLRSEMVHPAFKERGRAIPQPDPSGLPRRSNPPPRIVEGRPGPIPGMRPAMGGPGHMVAPSKQSNYGFMGVLMPIYTIGFVVFFTYTIMKLVFKKKTEAHVGAPLYPPCEPDEHFRKEVFEDNTNYFHRPSRDSSKIVVNAVSALLEEVNQELEARKVKTPETVYEQDEIKANGSLHKDDEQGTVKVMGMETTASCESGKKWSRPDSPVLPHQHPVAPKEPSPPPQQIFLERSLPPQSQILVAESATEAQKDSEDDSPVVLAGKMTLSVISLDSETGTEDSSNSCRKSEASDEERRTSSSNVSEEFEKIDAADLEDQINRIIEEAENVALTEENRYSLNEEPEQAEEIHKAPQINEKDKDNDVLEEIKNQLNLEDDLLLALKENEPEGKVSLPVTDIIKEFLDNEENTLAIQNKEIKIDDIERENVGILGRNERSLGEEHELELELDKDLVDGNEILSIIKKEVESSAFSDQKDLEVSEQQSLTGEKPENLDMNDAKLTETPIEDTKVLEVNTSNDYIEELPQTSHNVSVSLDSKEVKVTTEYPDSNKTEKILVPEKDLMSDSFQNNEASSELCQIRDEAVILENKELIISDEPDFEKKPQNEEEDEIILDTNLYPIRRALDLDLLEKDHQGPVSSEYKKYQNTTNLHRESSQESNGSNKADLLLQGLMVKEDVVNLDYQENIADSALSETSKHQKMLGAGQSGVSSLIDGSATEELQRHNEELKEEKTVVTENIHGEGSARIIDEDGLIDDEDYDYSEDDERVDDEVRDINREVYEDRRESMERRINGDNAASSRNGAANNEIVAENEISEEEDLENEDDIDEEIEEIIEYVDNTDDEGEEIVEINGNEHIHLSENGRI